MRRAATTMVLLAFLMFLPVLAAQEKKAASGEKAPSKDKKESLEKMVTGGEVVGTLTRWDGDKGLFAVEVSTKSATQNIQATNNLANLKVQYANAAVNKDRNAMLDLSRRMAQEQANLVNWKEEKHTLEFQATQEMKIRLETPTPLFDAKGKARKPTTKELADMKGPNKSLPGYTGDATDVRVGLTVKVFLPKVVKAQPKPNTTKKDRDAEKAAISPPRDAVMLMLMRDTRPLP